MSSKVICPADDQERNVYIHHIDFSDYITYVSPNWLSFALENAAPELTEAAVIGQRLWRYIADSDCRDIYRKLFAKIRKRGLSLTIPFRCDSPTVKRFMEMQIAPLAKGALQFRSRLVREEQQAHCPILDPETKRSDQWVTMCASCKTIKSPKEEWIDIAEAVSVQGLFTVSDVPNITYGMCPLCANMNLER